MVVWIQNPFDNLPGEGFRKMRYALMAEAFARAGHDVTVWTSDFSHALKRRRDFHDDGHERMRVRLVKTFPYKKNVSLRRVASHIAYARQFNRDAMRSVAAGIPRPGVIVSSFPTIYAADASIRLARQMDAKAVVDVQDAWPETFERIVPRWTLAPLRARARRIFRAADIVTGVCDRYRELVGRDDYIRAYLGIEPGERPEPPRSRTGRRRIAYVGGLGRTYDLDTVRAAAKLLDMDLAVAGGDNYLGEADLAALLAGCDVGVVPMRDDSWVGMPNKLFDYARAGLPIVSSLGGESAALIEKFRCGATYAAGDPDSLAERIRIALECPPGASRIMCEAELDARRIYDGYVRSVMQNLGSTDAAGMV